MTKLGKAWLFSKVIDFNFLLNRKAIYGKFPWRLEFLMGSTCVLSKNHKLGLRGGQGCELSCRL